MSVVDQDQHDALQQCLEDWREAQLPGGPGLRQELAYRDGFADALQWLRANTDVAQGRDRRQLDRLDSRPIHLHMEAD